MALWKNLSRAAKETARREAIAAAQRKKEADQRKAQIEKLRQDAVEKAALEGKPIPNFDKKFTGAQRKPDGSWVRYGRELTREEKLAKEGFTVDDYRHARSERKAEQRAARKLRMKRAARRGWPKAAA